MLIVNGEAMRLEEFLDIYRSEFNSREYGWRKRYREFMDNPLPQTITTPTKTYYVEAFTANRLEVEIDRVIRELDSKPSYDEEGEEYLNHLMRLYWKGG